MPGRLRENIVPDADAQGKNIWLAAGDGDLDRVKELVEREGLSPTVADQFTYTPVHAAASYGHEDILRYLITERSGDPNVTDDDGDTPLFVVERLDIAKLLVEELGADAKHVNKEGLTAARSLWEEQPEIATYLASTTGESLSVSLSEALSEADVVEGERTGLLTEALMNRVQAIMEEAERTGTDPEPRLREIVSEAVIGQLVDGERARSRRPPTDAEASDGGSTGGAGDGPLR